MRALFSNMKSGFKLKYFNKPSRHPLMYQWIISYVSILLLPLLIFSYYYVHSYHVVRKTSESNQKLILENISEQLSYIFYDSMTLSNTLILNKYVRSLSYDDSLITGNPDTERYYLSKELHSIKASNKLVENIIVYFPHSDYLVSATSAHQASLLPDMKNTPVTLEDLTYLCDALKDNSVLCIQSGNNSSLLLTQPLLAGVNREPLSIALVQIDKKILSNRLQSNLPFDIESSFALINQQDVLLSFGRNLAINNNTVTDIWKCIPGNTENILSNYEYMLDSQTYILNYKPYLLQNCGVISLTEKSIYNTTTYQLLENLLISLIFCLLLGLAVTFYYSKRNYRPVSQIIDYISKESDDSNYRNEYQLITRFLRRNQSELERQRTLLRNNYLIKVLRGEIPFLQISSQFSLQFSSSDSCVVGIQIKPESVTKYSMDDSQLLYFIIQNILSELLTPVFPEHDYCIVSQHEIYILVNIPFSPPQNCNYLADIRTALNELYQFISTNYDIEFTAGISDICPNEAIPDAFMQASSTLEYLYLFGQNNIKAYNELPLNPVITTIHLNTQDFVQNLLISGSEEQLDEYFSLLYSEIQSQNLSTSDARSCFYFFYRTTIQISRFCQTHYDFTPDSLGFINDKTYFSMPLQQSIESIHASYKNFIKEFSSFCDAYESSGWGNNICRYIENNYFDVNLNLNNVAEHFSLTPAYVSKKFKEKYNKSINDYLYEIRIAHAKQLITDTKLTMSEIAQMTGFIDSSAFIRIFKKYVGITPGKYGSSGISP